MIPILGILCILYGLLVVMAVTVDRREGKESRIGHTCRENLKQIDFATWLWAQYKEKTNSDIPTAMELYGAGAFLREEPLCPGGGKYTIGSVQQKPRCSQPGHTL